VSGADRSDHRTVVVRLSTAPVSAIAAQAVPAAEMNWSWPYGNPLSKYGCSQMARDL